MAYGFRDVYMTMYVVRKGRPLEAVGGIDLWIRGVAWSADGTVCAVRLSINGNTDSYVTAYDFSTDKAYLPPWSWSSSSYYEAPKDKVLLQHETIDKLLNAHGGPVPDVPAISFESINNTPRLTWAEWQKYKAARAKPR